MALKSTWLIREALGQPQTPAGNRRRIELLVEARQWAIRQRRPRLEAAARRLIAETGDVGEVKP